MRIALQPLARDSDEVEQRAQTFAFLLASDIEMRVEHIAELVTDTKYRVESVHCALEDDGNLAPSQRPQLPRRLLEDLDTAGIHAAASVDDAAPGYQRGWTQQPAGTEREGGLAGAALPGEADDLSRRECQADVTYRFDLAALGGEGDRQVANLEDRPPEPRRPAALPTGVCTRSVI